MASSTSPLSGFSGSSTFASQLQQIITHSVAIASLPLAQLRTSQADLQGRQSELQAVTNSFAAMQTAVNALGSSIGRGAFAANVGDSDIATASISSGIMAGSYTIDVAGIGSQTNTISQQSSTVVSDPSVGNISSGSTFVLSLNGQSYNIADPSGTLNGLAQAINESSATVQASVVNVGSSSAPDYRLSLQSLNYAPDSIQLSDGSSDLLTTLTTGANVTYQVNGQPTPPISSNSRSITVSPGLQVDLLKAGTTQITVTQSSANLASALSAFAGAYNSISTELNKNRGQNGGALSGDSIVYQLQTQLQKLANYSGITNGSSLSLADMGLSFDGTGTLSFDLSTFSKTASSSANALLDFIGTASSNGFLATAADMLNTITDETTGTLAATSRGITTQLSALATHISDEQAQVTALQEKLIQQMASVDSTISSLQNQLNEVTTLFSQMQTNQRALSGF